MDSAADAARPSSASVPPVVVGGMAEGAHEGRCPKCGIDAPIVPYFERNTNRLAQSAYALFGIVPGQLYGRARESSRVCSACGADRTLGPDASPDRIRAHEEPRAIRLRSARRAAAELGLLGLGVLAALGLAILAGRWRALAFLALAAAAIPLAAIRTVARARAEERRAAALERLLLSAEVLRLAKEGRGKLHAAEVAERLRVPTSLAEDLLAGMVDGDAVGLELEADGSRRYEFRRVN